MKFFFKVALELFFLCQRLPPRCGLTPQSCKLFYQNLSKLYISNLIQNKTRFMFNNWKLRANILSSLCKGLVTRNIFPSFAFFDSCTEVGEQPNLYCFRLFPLLDLSTCDNVKDMDCREDTDFCAVDVYVNVGRSPYR